MRLLTQFGIGVLLVSASTLLAHAADGTTTMTEGQMMMFAPNGHTKQIGPWGDPAGIEDVWAKNGSQMREPLFMTIRDGKVMLIPHDAKMSDGTMLSSHF